MTGRRQRLGLGLAPLVLALFGACNEPPHESTGGGGAGAQTSTGEAGNNTAAGGASTGTSLGGGGSAGGTMSTTTTDAPTKEIVSALAALPGVTIEEDAGETPSGHLLMVTIDQPVDHKSPAGPKFKQRIWLQHRGFEQPTVLASTGYNLYSNYEMEPTAILNGNQLLVEHRFFSPSRPEPANWQFLDIYQAASDHHAIVSLFKKIYPGAWISTGASKGGMTSVYHRRFYPEDVVGTVAYVAPQSYGNADPRYVDFLENVSDSKCRDDLKNFQKEVLLRRSAMTMWMADDLGESAYSQLGLDAALDFAVIELPFAFWQYGDVSNCALIPGSSAADTAVWQFLSQTDSPMFWSDDLFFQFEPYYFQAAVELGYPGYDDSHLTGLLSVPNGFDVAKSLVAPGPTKDMVFDPLAMIDIADWLANEGNRMLFVYGEMDPYSAAAFELGAASESFRFFAPGQNHGAMIVDLPQAEKEQAVSALGLWASVPPNPVPPEVTANERTHRLLR